MRNLKSNMDRFIVVVSVLVCLIIVNLKSNMDRFIEQKHCKHPKASRNLKSNMDRFIEILNTSFAFILGFKIQYG